MASNHNCGDRSSSSGSSRSSRSSSSGGGNSRTWLARLGFAPCSTRRATTSR